MIPNLDWMEHGNCRSVDPELWFPEVGHMNDTRMAKRLCGNCLVVDECLNWAIRTDARFGVWGGLTDKERRRMRLDKAS